jgi:hypothetical protein
MSRFINDLSIGEWSAKGGRGVAKAILLNDHSSETSSFGSLGCALRPRWRWRWSRMLKSNNKRWNRFGDIEYSAASLLFAENTQFLTLIVPIICNHASMVRLGRAPSS